jgi:hypothetical protein
MNELKQIFHGLPHTSKCFIDWHIQTALAHSALTFLILIQCLKFRLAIDAIQGPHNNTQVITHKLSSLAGNKNGKKYTYNFSSWISSKKYFRSSANPNYMSHVMGYQGWLHISKLYCNFEFYIPSAVTSSLLHSKYEINIKFHSIFSIIAIERLHNFPTLWSESFNDRTETRMPMSTHFNTIKLADAAGIRCKLLHVDKSRP